MKETYPFLKYFVEVRFHQDCFVEHASVAEICRDFLEREDPQTANGLRTELSCLLASNKSEAELTELLTAFGCEFDPLAHYDGYRDWLEHLSELFASPQKS